MNKLISKLVFLTTLFLSSAAIKAATLLVINDSYQEIEISLVSLSLTELEIKVAPGEIGQDYFLSSASNLYIYFEDGSMIVHTSPKGLTDCDALVLHIQTSTLVKEHKLKNYEGTCK